MKIREFSIEDFADVSQLWHHAGLEVRPGDSREELRRKLERDSELFLVAEEDSKIVGAVIGAWDGRRGWIYHLAVDPVFRRKRIARNMLREVERRMREKGVLRVHAMIFLRNAPSLNLFENLDYEKQSDLVVMGKTLSSKKQIVAKGGSSNRRDARGAR
jgi:ribosomal protein S18 acetylase RimI-like enzyme